ncbi:hypothetical protein A4X13_0g1659 [Tilletia indica]|uniref:Integrase catalytic domain-containing protein n=1 Tax=Tilletia indica TaxID=43049 RepID=A0A8T8TC68_9BASI|nr:hypothetical protein A4X13_0g1659 [Tilletia indica]
MRFKSEAAKILMEFHAQAVARYPDKPISRIRVDNALELNSAELKAYWAKHGVKVEPSPRYSPQSNGVAERAVRTVTEMCRTMLIAANLPVSFWPAAARNAAYVKNRVPATGLRRGETPYEALHGRPPKPERMRIFGCVAWAKIPEVHRTGKFGTKARPYIYLGPAFTNASRLWDPVARKEVIEHSVVFDEKGDARDLLEKEQNHQEEQQLAQLRALDLTSNHAQGERVEQAPADGRQEVGVDAQVAMRNALDRGIVPEGAREAMERTARGLPVSPGEMGRVAQLLDNLHRQLANRQPVSAAAEGASRPEQTADHADTGRRSARIAGHPAEELSLPLAGRKRKEPDGAYSAGTCFIVLEPTEVPYDDPWSVTEATRRPDRQLWLEAMQKELRSHGERGTWEVVTVPLGANLISAKWVFRVKRNGDASIQKYKARLVARGFTQVQGVDYDETFAPTSRLQILRLFCALVAVLDMDLHQIDFETAYLNANLTHDIYMLPPEGVELMPQQVLKLRRALYGLKQSAHDWYAVLRDSLKKIGFEQCALDPTIYVRNGENPAMLLVYVDDILVAAPKGPGVEAAKTELLGLFKGTDLGEAHYCLGIRIERNREQKTMSLDQERYAEEVLARFDMTNCKPAKTPMAAKTNLRKAVDGEPRADKSKYQALIGSMAYFGQGTRGDFAYYVSVLGKFCDDPSEEHWIAAKHGLRYLRGTSGARLVFGGAEDLEVRGYVDADWAADRDDRKSMSGYVFTVGGGAVAWGARKQGAVALSTAEAEYIAAGVAGREAVMLKGALTAAGQLVGTIKIHCDNQAAIQLVKNPGSHHNRSKHIDIVHHWIRDQTQQGAFAFEYIPTDLNPADAFTKALGSVKHYQHAERIGLDLRPKMKAGKEEEKEEMRPTQRGSVK